MKTKKPIGKALVPTMRVKRFSAKALTQKSFSAKEIKALETEAKLLGLDWEKIKKAVQKWGPLVVEAAKQLLEKGLSPEWVNQTIDVLGGELLTILKDWVPTLFSKSDVPGDLIKTAVIKLLILIVKKIAPDALDPFIDKYAESFLTWLFSLLPNLTEQEGEDGGLPIAS